MKNYVSTLILNAIFILFLPLIMTYLTQDGAILIGYIIAYSFLEYVIDSKRLNTIKTTLIDKSYFKTFFFYIITLGWNYLLFIACSVLISISMDPVIAILLILIALVIASYLETILDKWCIEYGTI